MLKVNNPYLPVLAHHWSKPATVRNFESDKMVLFGVFAAQGDVLWHIDQILVRTGTRTSKKPQTKIRLSQNSLYYSAQIVMHPLIVVTVVTYFKRKLTFYLLCLLVKGLVWANASH